MTSLYLFPLTFMIIPLQPYFLSFPPQLLNVRVSQDSLFGSLLTQHVLSAFIFLVPNTTNWIIRKWLIIKSWLTYCII